MSYQHLTIERDGAVERLTLNRPDVRNAFNEHVIAELTTWAAQARESAARHDIRTDFRKHAVGDFKLALKPGVAGIDDVEQQGCVKRLFQR